MAGFIFLQNLQIGGSDSLELVDCKRICFNINSVGHATTTTIKAIMFAKMLYSWGLTKMWNY